LFKIITKADKVSILKVGVNYSINGVVFASLYGTITKLVKTIKQNNN